MSIQWVQRAAPRAAAACRGWSLPVATAAAAPQADDACCQQQITVQSTHVACTGQVQMSPQHASFQAQPLAAANNNPYSQPHATRVLTLFFAAPHVFLLPACLLSAPLSIVKLAADRLRQLYCRAMQLEVDFFSAQPGTPPPRTCAVTQRSGKSSRVGLTVLPCSACAAAAIVLLHPACLYAPCPLTIHPSCMPTCSPHIMTHLCRPHLSSPC